MVQISLMNSEFLCLPLFLKVVFIGYRILGWLYLLSAVAWSWSTVFSYFVPWEIFHFCSSVCNAFFSLLPFKIFLFITGFEQFNYDCCTIVSFAWGSLSFLDLWFSSNLENFQPYSNIFLSSPFSLVETLHRLLQVDPQLTHAPFGFLKNLFRVKLLLSLSSVLRLCVFHYFRCLHF